MTTVREIVIVASTRVEAQLVRASADRVWPDKPEMLGAGDVLRLESIGFDCPIEEIYSDMPLV